jgi:hypothetical protein
VTQGLDEMNRVFSGVLYLNFGLIARCSLITQRRRLKENRRLEGHGLKPGQLTGGS